MKRAVLALPMWISCAIPAVANDVAWRAVAIAEPAVLELSASDPILVERDEPLFRVRLATDISPAARHVSSFEPIIIATIPAVQTAAVAVPFKLVSNPAIFTQEAEQPNRKSL